MIKQKKKYLISNLEERKKEVQELRENGTKVSENFDKHAERIKEHSKKLELMIEEKREKLTTIRKQNDDMKFKIKDISIEWNEFERSRTVKVCFECTKNCNCETIDSEREIYFLGQPIPDELKIRCDNLYDRMSRPFDVMPIKPKNTCDAEVQTGPNLLCYIYEQNDGLLTDIITKPAMDQSFTGIGKRIKQLLARFRHNSTEHVLVMPDKTVQVKLDDNLVVETVSSNIRYYNRELKHGLRRMSMPGKLTDSMLASDTSSDGVNESSVFSTESQI